jgi:hypothetical protein
MNRNLFIQLALAMLLVASLACNIGTSVLPEQTIATPPQPIAPEAASPTGVVSAETSTPILATPTTAVVHTMKPADLAATGQQIYDVESDTTAPEKRAPYGDSYDINRLECPFLQDMTYVPDLDISTFNVGQDADWFYVSISLVGNDPNDKLGIDYAVELDTNHDGFGDYLIWAHPPYPTAWDTAPVQIFEDTNHDTGGHSAEKSDAPLAGNGYDSQIFNGGVGDADPDVAWVRANSGAQALVQFALKKSWSGSVFMLGVMADAGLKDPKKLDYVDRFTLAQAGSPIRGSSSYPLKALFAVDNVCREHFGFKSTGDEPQLCPSTAPPATKRPRTPEPPPTIDPNQVCLPPGTMIDTPTGPVAVEQLRIGDPVWSSTRTGSRMPATILEISHVSVPAGHILVHVILDDGRELWASPGHPTADGRMFADITAGDLLDGALVRMMERVPPLDL